MNTHVLVYTLIFILLFLIVVLVSFTIFRQDLFRKGYAGYDRVGGASFTKKIDIKVTEDDLRKRYKELAEEENRDRYNTSFCKGEKLCKKYCKDSVCRDFRDQKIVYDHCVECENDGLCWSRMKNGCVECNDNNRGCNRRFGCNGGKLINPANNFCKICWKQW